VCLLTAHTSEKRGLTTIPDDASHFVGTVSDVTDSDGRRGDVTTSGQGVPAMASRGRGFDV
jgi:hypothetical protein